MTAVIERDAPAASARAAAFPLPPEATVVGGLFQDLEGPGKVMRALRAAGSASDTVGIAIPLPGDPEDPETLAKLQRPRGRRFDPLAYLKVVLDPHEPPPTYQTLIQGRNSALVRFVLGDLDRWLVGVQPFRIPSVFTADEKEPAGESGVWVLGRSNHAAAVAGSEHAGEGGALGALAGVGVPRELVAAYAARIRAGEILLTICETDSGRVRRDTRWLRKHGATGIFEHVIVSPRRSQG